MIDSNGSDEEILGVCKIQSITPTKKPEQKILSEMEIQFPEGTVTGILGPSGSGKTTLLSFVTDNIPSNLTARGKLEIPGSVAFVPQDDRLHGFYTCKSYLEHYARLSGLPVNEETNNYIDELLVDVGLAEQANTIVGDIFFKGLSGGQMRRLSIALEALTRPDNLFLDEPTSGLDAESALQVLYFLKRYVRAAPHRRVILTIHQPSSFIWKEIDNIALLAKGTLVYQGPRTHMESFFDFAGYPTPAEYNPADHYVTVVNDDFGNHKMSVDEWGQTFTEFEARTTKDDGNCRTMGSFKYRSSWINARTKDEIETQRAGPVQATVELTTRYFRNLFFNPGILGTRIAMYSMLALMVGSLFWDLGNRHDFASIQSRTAILFYCVAFFIFMSIAVLPFTVMERSIVDKEVRNSYYHPAIYQVAQGIASIPGTAILAFIVTLVIITLTKLKEPLWYFITMFLSLLCGEALAQLVSHIVPHFVIGMAIVAGLYGFFMLFMGFMLVPSEFPDWLSWTYYVGMQTYSWRVFMYTEFCCDDEQVW
eukprot:CAMPEP_0195282398 /NCGR_PEP_ID=MMETSP0707-20130614/1285_1 /TAXON_ID=33640 /ORGANISM="Asterionellopsis glacialis, Strain CCMP134" /LENGTH=536 /DNA_ID=CAMNT_0040341363 /DNA_START=81 /DNA_END=1688 /DNA_ORIENTATION=-